MVHVHRRRLLLSAGALLAVPFAAEAQKAGKVWRIGVLRPGPQDGIWLENFAPFRHTMQGLGYTEGANLLIEYRVRPGRPEEILDLAKDLVRTKVDAILAISAGGVDAAAKATTSIPIVANDNESDPVARGYAATLARPGRNITGLFLDFPEMAGKWIELLKEAVPKLARIAVLWDPAIGPYLLKGVEAAAASMQMQILGLEARAPREFAGAFESASRRNAQALLVLTSPVLYPARKELAVLALKHRLPAIMSFSGFADDGGLMAYGPNLFGMFRQSAAVMAKVLEGAHPAEIPIERPMRFEMIINMKTANALDIKIPQSLLVRADRVIQ